MGCAESESKESGRQCSALKRGENRHVQPALSWVQVQVSRPRAREAPGTHKGQERVVRLCPRSSNRQPLRGQSSNRHTMRWAAAPVHKPIRTVASGQQRYQLVVRLLCGRGRHGFQDAAQHGGVDAPVARLGGCSRGGRNGWCGRVGVAHEGWVGGQAGAWAMVKTIKESVCRPIKLFKPRHKARHDSSTRHLAGSQVCPGSSPAEWHAHI